MIKTYGPYEPIRKAGNFLYVSGQVGVDPETATAPRDVAEQTAQTLKNMETVLKTAGATLNNVVKTTVFLTDMSNFAVMNEAYQQAFEAPRPSRSTIGVRELPGMAGLPPLLVEIEAVAYMEDA